MSDATTRSDGGEPTAERGADDADAPGPSPVSDPTADPAGRARRLLAATGARLAYLAFVSAVPLVTLCLLVAVEALVGGVPRIVLVTPGGEYSVSLTKALAFLVVGHLGRRLYALNAGEGGAP
jgi:hypothetical protein